MKCLVKICFLVCILLAGNVAAKAQFGTICGDPSQTECTGQFDGFKPQDLIFNTGRTELVVGERYESNEFYAVILESVPAQNGKSKNCNFVSEPKRKTAQKLFPKNKIFASRSYCGGNVILYDNMKDEFNFMAIYAGESAAEAAKILSRAKKKFPSANIRKTKVILDLGDE